MKLITPEEAKKFIISSQGKSYLRLRLENLKPGEILHLERKDVENKRGPFETVSRITTSKKTYSVETIMGGGGWLVTRLT